ncbi:MAG: SDR family oxidoreductase [Acidimicrobiales bacterium]|jgi:meso-butanediol dehydrogenase/(S,S)-butanediol dehydrogenase/diacetyl reductase|nr:SDR family oxidoreductase [Acidimicrobiales bacterium]
MSVPEDGRVGLLTGRVALVSGAAAGIGAAVARRFAGEGAVLWLNDLRAEPLHELVESLRAHGVDATGTAGDMADAGFVRAWVEAAVDAHGRVDVLYNNVGVSRPGLVADITDEDWRFQQRTTLDSVFFATRAVLPHMVHQGGGSIVSMASGAGIGGNYNLGAYAAAKAGVINLMETVATEYGVHGIRANAVTPGPTDTEPLRAYIEGRPGGMAAYVGDLDLARLSRPDEVANTVLFLASDQSSNITGICLRSNIRAASRRPMGGNA